MKGKVWTWMAVVVGVLAVCGPVFAHHGAAAYDRKITLTLKATITEFKYVNPHAQISFDATDDQGNVVHWNCETANPAMLVRQGWTRETLKSGDHVTIVGNPSKTGVKIMVLQKLILADGKELDGKQLD